MYPAEHVLIGPQNPSPCTQFGPIVHTGPIILPQGRNFASLSPLDTRRHKYLVLMQVQPGCSCVGRGGQSDFSREMQVRGAPRWTAFPSVPSFQWQSVDLQMAVGRRGRGPFVNWGKPLQIPISRLAQATSKMHSLFLNRQPRAVIYMIAWQRHLDLSMTVVFPPYWFSLASLEALQARHPQPYRHHCRHIRTSLLWLGVTTRSSRATRVLTFLSELLRDINCTRQTLGNGPPSCRLWAPGPIFSPS